MTIPRLDPFTLRYLADEHVREAKRYDEFASACRKDALFSCYGAERTQHEVAAHGWSHRAYQERMRAKRLRALATKSEKRRRR
jgi:peptidoglycan/xylan/chitin deacetylase (PgdA/CDA1 family)